MNVGLAVVCNLTHMQWTSFSHLIAVCCVYGSSAARSLCQTCNEFILFVLSLVDLVFTLQLTTALSLLYVTLPIKQPMFCFQPA
jgi:hypothetical protein